jgi:hypothetical protein
LPEGKADDMAGAVAEQLAVLRLARIEFVSRRRQPAVQLVVTGEDAVAAALPQTGETRIEQALAVDRPSPASLISASLQLS